MDLYHVLNRGTDKRKIVMDDRDRRRFVRNLFEMNDDNPVYNTSRREALHDIGRRVRKPLVQIHGWCLMNNHYHILLSEIIEGGLAKFLKKLNMGYSKYFNQRHHRVGTLFQGKTKRVLVDNERHFLYILIYIHCNPLDYLRGAKTWRITRISKSAEPLKWLAHYEWSSFNDYADNRKYSEIIEGSELFSHSRDHILELTRYLAALRIDDIKLGDALVE